MNVSGAAKLDSTLIVNALSDFNITAEQTIDLITAQKGISGTFSSVNFSNFPPGVISEIIYLPTVVELKLIQAITPGASSMFSVPGITLTAVNEINSLIARKNYAMHGMILKKKKQKEDKTEIDFPSSPNHLITSAEPLASTLVTDNQILQRKQSQLVQEEEIEYSSRFYIAPIKSFGSFKKQGISQWAFGLNSVGIFSGYDHIFGRSGIGVCANYNYTHAKLHHYHTAHFNIHQIHATGYATWVPNSIEELAIDALVGGGFSWYNTYRNAGSSFTRVKANTQGGEGDTLLGIEYIFSNSRFQAIPDHLHLVPFANFQYIWAHVDDYHEQGAGIYGLR
ncbi:MAG: autotransporter outer membrane beta-barrel domain-containing protein, partial [Rhabdochlamydiaceae bacterium]